MRCVVPRCRSQRYGRDSTISFHKFPKMKSKRDQWIAALNLNTEDFDPLSIVCSSHFRKQDFHTDSKVYRSGLKSNALPHLADELPDFEVIEMINSGDKNQTEAQMISCDEDDDYEDFYNQNSNLEITPFVDSNESIDGYQATSLELQRTKELAKSNALRTVEKILPLSIGLQHEKDNEPIVDSLGSMGLEDKVKYLQKALVEKDRVIKLLNTKLRFKSERIVHLISKLKKKHKLMNKKR